MGVLEGLVAMLQTVAACPNAGYCIAARRLDCGACPVRPELENPLPDVAIWGDLTNSGLSHGGDSPGGAEPQGEKCGKVAP